MESTELKALIADLNIINDQFDPRSFVKYIWSISSTEKDFVKIAIDLCSYFVSKYEIQPIYVCLRHLEKEHIVQHAHLQIIQECEFLLRVVEENIIAADNLIEEGLNIKFADNIVIKTMIRRGNLDMVKYLVEKNVINDPNDILTALDLAENFKQSHIFEYLASETQLQKILNAFVSANDVTDSSNENDESDESGVVIGVKNEASTEVKSEESEDASSSDKVESFSEDSDSYSENDSDSESDSDSNGEESESDPEDRETREKNRLGNPNPEPKARFFKLISPNGQPIGRYVGSTPRVAASKAFSVMMRQMRNNGQEIPQRTTVQIRESSENSGSRIYSYVASREKLVEPQVISITDAKTGQNKQITYSYRNRISNERVQNRRDTLENDSDSSSETNSLSSSEGSDDEN
jgi:hypothetical protein